MLFFLTNQKSKRFFIFPKVLHIKEMPKEIKGAIKELEHINFENVVVEVKDKVFPCAYVCTRF